MTSLRKGIVSLRMGENINKPYLARNYKILNKEKANQYPT